MAEEAKAAGDETGRLLLDLYRLAYESIGGASKDSNGEAYKSIKQEWLTLANSYDEGVTAEIKKPPETVKELLDVIEALLTSHSKAQDVSEPAKPSGPPEPPKPAKAPKEEHKNVAEALESLCSKDAVDEAILLILRYKLEDAGHSAHAICEYQVDKSGGWSTSKVTAVHAVIQRLRGSNKDSKQQRRLFLFEVFLREGVTTQNLRYQTGGWATQECNHNVWESTVNANCQDALDLIFRFGKDVDVNTLCQDNNSGNKAVQYSKWRPIHKAIKNGNFGLVGVSSISLTNMLFCYCALLVHQILAAAGSFLEAIIGSHVILAATANCQSGSRPK